MIKEEITTEPAGTRVRLTFRMPQEFSGVSVAALKIRKFYLRTADYSWVEIEFPDFHDHMIINSRYGN